MLTNLPQKTGKKKITDLPTFLNTNVGKRREERQRKKGMQHTHSQICEHTHAGVSHIFIKEAL